MGPYISLNIEFPNKEPLLMLLEPAFSSAFFKPKGLVGHAYKKGDHWFLSGYALDNYVVDRDTFRSITLPENIEESERKYLQGLVKEFRDGKVEFSRLSPIETVEPETGIGFTQSLTLNKTTLEEASRWLRPFFDAPAVTMSLFGSLNLSMHDAMFPWGEAFRDLLEDGTPWLPILDIKLRIYNNRVKLWRTEAELT